MSKYRPFIHLCLTPTPSPISCQGWLIIVTFAGRCKANLTTFVGNFGFPHISLACSL